MKLCCRGVFYESLPTLEVTEREITGKVSGNFLARHLSAPCVVRRSTFGLKYRGAVCGVRKVNFTHMSAFLVD